MIKQKLINTGRWIKDKVYAGGRWVKRNVKKVLVATGIIGVALAAGTGVDTPTIPTIDVNGEVISFPYTDDNTGEDLIIRTDSEKIYGITYVMVENKSGTAQDVELSAFFGDERHKVKEVYKLVEDIEKERILPVYETSTQDCSYTNSTTEEFIEQECIVSKQTGTTSETYYIDEWQPQQLKDFSGLSYQDKIVQKDIPIKAKRNFEAKKKIQDRIDNKSYYKVEISYPLQGEEDHEFFLEAIGSEGAYGHLDPFLGTWSYRQKLTIDNTKIDDDLTHFPVTVFFSNSNGSTSQIFDEVGSASTNIAFTTDDEETQLYGEIEEWDESASTAVIHVSKTGWEIASSTDTDFYVYYDSTEDANTTYIGNDPDDTPSNNVWDSNYKAVHHMNDITTSTVKDSTDNNNDGTKEAANQPEEIDGKIGKAQDKASGEYVELGTGLALTEWTYEYWYNKQINGDHWYEVLWRGDDSDNDFMLNETGSSDENFRWRYGFTDTNGALHDDTWIYPGENDYNQWAKYSARFDGTNLKLDRNTSNLYTSENLSSYTPRTSNNKSFNIGLRDEGDYARGVFYMDELRISNSARSDAWLKASYYTQNDDFLTYGAEEDNLEFIVASSTDQYRSASTSMRLQYTGTTSLYCVAASGTQVDVGAWFYTESYPTTATRTQPGIGISELGMDASSSMSTTSNGVWEQVTISATPTDDGRADIIFWAEGENNSEYLYIDDITCTQDGISLDTGELEYWVDASTPAEYVYNLNNNGTLDTGEMEYWIDENTPVQYVYAFEEAAPTEEQMEVIIISYLWHKNGK